ncbi:lysylphosphatidylglycerol synthase transmembrane domain-containing protein [Alloyangia pacifica]|uniref:lysylphosphatidylglycerol synthase transmembrane domain-containing protein n=1 Tax=Alloyangia pacifica TaxID=311180 RepID=UPI001CD7053D|nr:lysylphosphatidylglycerol synthase transmembrane domain-containing protein [Alloyangia pacifica]MCA0998009.1 flippase-like domain-containing protein [Alloyangia pacifica]
MSALRLLLPLGLIGVCLWLADGREALRRLAELSPGWGLATLALLNAVTLLSALRWRRTAAALGLQMPRGEAAREYYMAQFVNQTLPGGVLGDAARAARSRQNGPLSRAAQAVVLERAAGQAGMGFVALTGLVLMLAGVGGPSALGFAPSLWLPGAMLVLMLGALAVLASQRRGRAQGWRAAARIALLGQWRTQGALSLVIAALTVAAFVTAARASGSLLPAGHAALIVPLILTAMLLPASVAGWGWREGAAAALFPLAGLSAEAGLAASIAFGLISLLSALPGAFFLRRSPQAPTQGTAGIASPHD